MPKVVIEVMPKAEILDPQGQAITKALDRLGYPSASSVRQGKRFELEFDHDVSAEQLESIASDFLANTVIEDYKVSVDNGS